jgi:hypothetical protein
MGVPESALMRTRELSLQLSYKLQDAVSEGNSDGLRYSAEARLLYIQRAHHKLLRLLKLLAPDMAYKIAQDFYRTITGIADANGYVTLNTDTTWEVSNVFVKYAPNSEEYKRCDFIEPKDWLKVKLALNPFYKPDLTTETFYWSIVNGQIELLPELPYNVLMEVFGAQATLDYTGNDIAINPEYYDVILMLAASEAYLDYGQRDWAQQYLQNATDEIKIIAGKQTKLEGKDENKT